MKNKIYLLLLVFVFSLAFFLRFNKLGEIPNGLEQDETSIGYNAYSILQAGKDEYGVAYPLYFKAFGEYKLPLYIYAVAASEKIFGLNAFAVRFPSAFFGFLTVILFYFFVKEFFEKTNSSIPIFATLLLALNPWHIHFSRGAFEVTISLFFIVAGVLFYLLFLKKKQFYLLPIAVILASASIYTYNIARLFTPLLSVLLIVLYKNDLKKKRKSIIISSILLYIVLLMPFTLSFFSKGGVVSTEGTLIFSSAAVQAPLLEFRMYLINLPQVFVKIFFNQAVLVGWQYLQNILSFLSVPFFFISGSMHGNHGIGNVGELYVFELPFVVLGLIGIIKNRLRWGYLFIIWGIVTIAVASLTREVPHATRSFFLVVPLEAFSAYGISSFLKLTLNLKYRNLILALLGIVVIYNLVFYFTSYYVRFPILYAKAWRAEDKQLSLYIAENLNKYDKIIVDRDSGFIYTSYLFYSKYPPSDFQNTSVRYPDDSEGFSDVKSFGKFEFRSIDWNKDPNLKKSLIVTSLDRKPKDASVLATFYYPKRPIAIALKQEILQYPVEEVAYVLIETK